MGDWGTFRLDEVMTLQRGHDLPAGSRGIGAVPIIGSFGITGYHDVAKYHGPGVAIGRSGASIGVATWCAEDYWPLNTCLFVKDFHGNDPRWVYYLLDSIDFVGFNSGSAQPSLNRNHLANVPIPLPPLSEQRAIAEVLGALDDKIEANRTIAERAERLATALPLSAVASTTVGSVAGVCRKLVSTAYFAGQDVEHFSLPAFDANRLPLVENGDGIKSGKFVLEGPTVLVSKLNPHIPRVWMAAPIGLCPAITSTEFVGLVPSDDYPVEVLWALCASAEFSSQLAEMVKGTTGSHQRVSADDVLTLRVPDPQALGQRATETITATVCLVGTLRRESVRLAMLRDALLPKLLSGALRVRMPAELVGRAI